MYALVAIGIAVEILFGGKVAFFGSIIITIIIKYGHEMRHASPKVALATVL